MVKVLPSMLTVGNLLCGFAAIFYASRDPQTQTVFSHWSPLTAAAALIFVGMICDALDGRVARFTRQTSDLGEQLDSMADMVTFGVAPAFLVIQLVHQQVGVGTPFLGSEKADTFFGRVVFVIAAVYVACCAIRLARFNLEMEQDEEADHLSFTGLPSPAAAGTIASLVLLHQNLVFHNPDSPRFAQYTAMSMVVIALAAAIGMISNLKYVHLANRYLRGRAPLPYVTTAIIIFVLTLIHPQLMAAACFATYALSAPVIWVAKRMGRNGARSADDAPAEDAETESAEQAQRVGHD